MGRRDRPLVVALAVALRILHDGVAVLDADGIVEPPHSAAAVSYTHLDVYKRQTHDMLPQHGNLGHALFRSLDPCGKLVKVSGR